MTTRLLYLRGEKEGGQISDYLDGFRSVGLAHVDHALVPNAGHFTQEEAPEHTWRLIAEFTRPSRQRVSHQHESPRLVTWGQSRQAREERAGLRDHAILECRVMHLL